MLVAWLLTLPGAGLVGGLAALLSPLGVGGVVALLILLSVACAIIYAMSRRHRVNQNNVTDSREVLVLASASPSAYAADGTREKKAKKSKARTGAR
jgi:PiT family inorganic phosphate transporter